MPSQNTERGRVILNIQITIKERVGGGCIDKMTELLLSNVGSDFLISLTTITQIRINLLVQITSVPLRPFIGLPMRKISSFFCLKNSIVFFFSHLENRK